MSPAPPDDSAKRSAEARNKIVRFAETIEKRNHFELFGVTKDAGIEQIREIYRNLAKQWHTDAYAGLDLGSERDTLDKIFQRITGAYETLSNEPKRAEYLVYLDRVAKGMVTDVAAVLEGERLFDEGLVKMKRGDYKGARADLEHARKLNPDDQLLAANFAWALYNEAKRSKHAALESTEILKKAVKIQENLALGYQHLGTIYFQQKNPEEARKWWKKCLEHEPSNIESSRGLRLLATRGSKSTGGIGALVEKIFGKR